MCSPSSVDSTTMHASLSAIIQCSCAVGSCGEKGVPVMAMPDKAAFASRTDPHRPRIHGISSNCATYAASFPRTASL